jgi:hypothetical protein
MTNPLQKYRRQPKIYVNLPSNGNYYSPGVLNGDASSMPIYAMTGMDEIIMKTPDALFNGEATAQLIESCCPYINSGKLVPSIDVDLLLAAIRLATFGDELSLTHVCKSCESVNDYTLSTQSIIDHYSSIQYDNKITIDDLTIYFRPLTYEQTTQFNKEHFTLQKILKQLNEMVDIEERQQQLEVVYTKIKEVQAKIFLLSIESIHVDDQIVDNIEHIADWIGDCDRIYYTKIKAHLEKLKADWKAPTTKIKCPECEAEDETELSLDQSDFFE